jgi:hypothetical protein
MSKAPDWKLPVLPTRYVDPSGLVRVRPQSEEIELPEGLVAPEAPVLAMTDLPSFEDQLYSYTTARELLGNLVQPEFVSIVEFCRRKA